MDIYFLHHSGFIIDDNKRAYIFDAYKDPMGDIDKMAEQGRELWFFVSHIHSDHFDKMIEKYESKTTKYFVHKDVPLEVENKDNAYFMEVGDKLNVDGVEIDMYGSTDAGGSFLIDIEEGRIFHAGDLNWWHWLGDTEENNKGARKMFETELERMEGLSVDIAFFPVDSRLEEAREWGVDEWLEHVAVRELLVPMHMHDIEEGGWQPSEEFKEKHESLNLWIPAADGEKGSFNV